MAPDQLDVDEPAMSEAAWLSQAEDELERLADEHGLDWAFKCNVGSRCCWAGELRITPEPNDPDGPDVSVVVYSAGEASPTTAFAACLMAMRERMPTLHWSQEDAYSIADDEAAQCPECGAHQTDDDPCTCGLSARTRERGDTPIIGARAALENLEQVRIAESDVERVAQAVTSLRAVLRGIRALAMDYAEVDGAHHKQFALVRCAALAGADVDEIEDKGLPA